MRRLSAILLLVPLCILFIGAVNLSTVCPVTHQDSCTHPIHSCCHQKKAPCPKNHKTDRAACCFDCPLCALITNPAFIRFKLTRTETTIEYAVSPDNSLTDYYQHHWKPPDSSPFA
jgi:hypothetical protein